MVNKKILITGGCGFIGTRLINRIKKKFKIQNFEIFVDRCIKDYRQGYLETLAHVQIKDTNIKTKNIVYIFNNWMFTSYPSLNSFDHPNFDIWLENCS